MVLFFCKHSEKYLQNLLQIEIMLKVWFPPMASKPAATAAQSAAPILRSRWCQNQLHIPVKVSFLVEFYVLNFMINVISKHILCKASVTVCQAFLCDDGYFWFYLSIPEAKAKLFRH